MRLLPTVRSYTPLVPRLHLAVPIGLVAGLVGGLFGVGGGVVVVPGLVLLLGFSQHDASGTSTATIVASAAAALLVFGSEGEVDWGAAGVLVTGSALGAWLGARYVHRIPERWLTAGFALLVLVAAARLGLS